MIQTTARYTDQRLIGKGAYGEVFVALDATLQRQVAIKRYYKSTNELVQVISALDNWSKLNHPNIAQVLDFSKQNGELFLVMTYCDKAGLDQSVKSLKSNQEYLARLFLQISSAVTYMHELGLIHRDLKLANVLLDATNAAVLIDLDLSIKTDSPLAREKVGTPHYMAPELLDGSAPSSSSTDQYALGVMLYEMLSGRIISQEPQPIIAAKSKATWAFELDTSIPKYRDWNAVIAKATHVAPVGRYQKVAALADDVERLIAGKPISARVMTRFERSSRWIRSNPLTGSLLAIVFAVLTVGFLTTSIFWSRSAVARASIVSQTILLNQRIEEAKLRKSELASLLTSVQKALSQAENAEKEQQSTTEAAQASKEKWQAEAERATTLTSELDGLLVKAKASVESVVASEKRRDKAIERFTTEQQREYAQKVDDLWSRVQKKDWEEARQLFKLLPNESKGIEYEILSSAIDNMLCFPVRIRLGSSAKQFGSGDRIETGTSNPISGSATISASYSLGGKKLNYLLIQRHSGRFRLANAILHFPVGGRLSISTQLLENEAEIVGLLTDGSLLVSVGGGYSLLTFAPQNYEDMKVFSSQTKMLPHTEDRISQNLIELSRLESAQVSNPLQGTKNEPSPPGLEPSEAKAWEYCGSIGAQVQLSSDYRNIVQIQSTEKSEFNDKSFSVISSLSHLKIANFARSGITNQCLASLAKCHELHYINLQETARISDDGVRELNSLPSLKTLDIGPSGITDRGLDVLEALPNLTQIDLRGTPISEERVEQFRKKRPNCRVLR